MILAIDAGNTRTKWGLARDDRSSAIEWSATGILANGDIDALTLRLRALPRPRYVIVADVGAVIAAGAIERALPDVTIERLRATAARAGVTSAYAVPETLGADRWATLIGARARHTGAAIVVSCGTATTIDRLDHTGRFTGGMILPGAALMKRALAEHTAGLPLAVGEYRESPRNTADAIETGCLFAQLGAIERVYAATRDARCFLTGGGAAQLAPLLAVPHELVEHLTLEGLVRVAP